MPGPSKKPRAFKVLSGTVQPCRDVPEAGPDFDLVKDFPAEPMHLTPDGAEMWRTVGPQLVNAGVLQIVDLALLEQLCFAWQQFRKKVKADMDVTASEHNALLALFTQFGMTPASRKKVMAKPDETKSTNRFAKYGQSGK